MINRVVYAGRKLADVVTGIVCGGVGVSGVSRAGSLASGQ